MRGNVKARSGPTLPALEKETMRKKRSTGPDQQLLLEHRGPQETSFLCKAEDGKLERHSVH